MKLHVYHCERNDKTVYIVDRKTKPKMGAIITVYGSKWRVWYIEEPTHGFCRARCEKVEK